MSSLANALVSQVLGHSDAEKAFRPWWDNFEDYLVYALVMLGLIVLPTAIINGTPLDCTLCQPGICPSNITRETNPGYNVYWVKKHCTYTAINEFVLYFPYTLLIMAFVIVLIERFFVTIFKAGLKLDAFYNLLVRESLLDGTVATSSNEKNQTVTKAQFVGIEDTKLVFEVAQSFNHSSSYFYSYLIRTLSEFAVASSLLAWLIIKGIPIITDKNDITGITNRVRSTVYCPVGEYYYRCSGHPQEFYLYALFATIVILIIYSLLCIYQIMWIFIPQLGSLSGMMKKYKREFKKIYSQNQSDQELFGDLYNLYFNNRDLKLLLDLLAKSSGVEQSLRNMREMAEVRNLDVAKCQKEDSDRMDAVVIFEDPTLMNDVFFKISDINCTYTVEVAPPLNSGSMHALRSDGVSQWSTRKLTKLNVFGDTELASIRPENVDSAPLKRTKFKDIDPTIEYTFRVCTLINGKAIARKLFTLKPKKKTEEGESAIVDHILNAALES